MWRDHGWRLARYTARQLGSTFLHKKTCNSTQKNSYKALATDYGRQNVSTSMWKPRRQWHRALELYRPRRRQSNKKSKKYAVTTVTSGIGEKSGCIRARRSYELAAQHGGDDLDSRYHCAYVQCIASKLIIQTTKSPERILLGLNNKGLHIPDEWFSWYPQTNWSAEDSGT